MSGKIIEFRSRDLKRGSLYRQQPVPRGPTGEATLKLQIARIFALLEELEDLTRSANECSSPLLLQARSTVERTRSILLGCAEPVPGAGLEKNVDRDPQPDIDRALLERMYRDLNPST
jgi:hypothetical protein